MMLVSKIPGALKNVDPNAGLGAPKATTDAPSLRVIFQEVSVVFILISAYYCMVLTNWATLQSSSSISDPLYGDVALWLQASAQWIAILLYIWTLFAPKIFPIANSKDRFRGNKQNAFIVLSAEGLFKCIVTSFFVDETKTVQSARAGMASFLRQSFE